MKWIVTKLLAHNCFLGTKEKNNYAVEKKKQNTLTKRSKLTSPSSGKQTRCASRGNILQVPFTKMFSEIITKFDPEET